MLCSRGLRNASRSRSSDASRELFSRKVQIAPMQRHTNAPFRKLIRLISRESMQYTEMVVAASVVRGNGVLNRYMPNHEEGRVVLQLAGNDPEEIGEAARIAQERCGETMAAVNLNCGCPSAKVATGNGFGVNVGKIMVALKENVSEGVGVSLKCRIGLVGEMYEDAVGESDEEYAYLKSFVEKVHSISGLDHFVVHSRKALLGKNMSPRANRIQIPLQRDMVYRLQEDFPHIDFTLNGEITTRSEMKDIIARGLSVMLGREVVRNPCVLRHVDEEVYGRPGPNLSREEIIMEYVEFAEAEQLVNPKLSRSLLLSPVVGMFYGVGGSGDYKKWLSRGMSKKKTYPPEESMTYYAKMALKTVDEEARTMTPSQEKELWETKM